MIGSTIRRAWLPWRNRLIELFPGLHRFASRFSFSIRHLPRLANVGWSAPLPPLLKRSFLRGIARDEKARVFVETGTYLGDTTWWFRDDFDRLYTIEVDPFLYDQAKSRFARIPRIEALLGDSSNVLVGVVPTIESKALYWLDGHYSAGITGSGESHCPIMSELDAIYERARAPFVIVIDDARCFGHDPAYPSASAVRECIASLSEGRDAVTIENDMIIVRQPSNA
jgi:hypothetical protein